MSIYYIRKEQNNKKRSLLIVLRKIYRYQHYKWYIKLESKNGTMEQKMSNEIECIFGLLKVGFKVFAKNWKTTKLDFYRIHTLTQKLTHLCIVTFGKDALWAKSSETDRLHKIRMPQVWHLLLSRREYKKLRLAQMNKDYSKCIRLSIGKCVYLSKT